ncbi:MAG: DUF1840 domain-containing protein [Betaproteobacteria bacterium]|jgi:hypothetical protein|nr:DUF1840 domain-containing protein [Betaproteobacteria bacterium]
MLFKFKSNVTGDLIMLEPNGKRVLAIIGKEASPKGIITPEQMPSAIAALEQAVQTEETEHRAAVDKANAEGKPTPQFEAVSLRQRAVPFVDMLKRCSREGKEIVWGV